MTIRLGRGEDIYELLKVASLNGLLGEYSGAIETIETGSSSGLPHSVSGADIWIPAVHFETGGASSPHRVSGADVWIPAHWLDFGAAVSTHGISGADVYNKTPLYIDTVRASSPHGASGADVYHAFADMLIVTEVDGAPLVTDVKRIVFDNGTVTDSGGGVARVTGGSSTPPGYFGDGSDGDVTIGVNTELDGIMHYANLTIDAGVELTPGFAPIVFVKNTLTLNGTIINNGVNGTVGSANSGATGGAGGLDGAYGKIGATDIDLVAGGDGGNTGAPGLGGVAVDVSFVATMDNATVQAGASGGNGAVGIGGAGYPGQAPDVITPIRSYAMIANISQSLPDLIMVFSHALPGGTGGGGGGSTAGGGGGGGRGGLGGNIVIVARNIVWGAAGLIEATGGNGGNGGNSGGDGGGGGGGSGGNGGIVVLCYETETGSRDVDVSKGTGGNGGTSVSASAGANGPNGYDGVVIYLGE